MKAARPRRHTAAAAALLAAGLLLTGCAQADNAPPTPTDTASPSSASPDATTSNEETSEFVSVTSGLEVDYDAFVDWDSKKGENSFEARRDFQHETSKRSVCNTFFTSNGLEINIDQHTGYELDSNGEDLRDNGDEFVNSMFARQNMILALARDDTDPRNLDVAYNLVECVTTPDSESRQYITSQISGIRDGSIQPQELTLQSIDKYIRERDGRVFATYTTVDSEGIATSYNQLWKAVGSGSGLYRSENYGPAGE